MAKKYVNRIVWILFFIIFVPLTFMCGIWTLIPITKLYYDALDVLTRILGIYTIFLVIVLFLLNSKRNVKVMLMIILLTFWVSLILVTLYVLITEAVGNPF